MFPENCENCGLKTDELTEMPIPNKPPLNWFICLSCYGKLYQHDYYSRPEFKDICLTCGKPVNHHMHN